MSSPVHHSKNLDAALMYAPPWARNRTASSSAPSGVSPATSMAATYGIHGIDGEDGAEEAPAYIGDQAMLELKRQMSLDPELVPEPPLLIGDGIALRQIAVRLSAVGLVAAVAAWAIVSLEGPKSAPPEVTQADVVPALTVGRVKLVHVRAEIATPVALATAETPQVRAAIKTPEAAQGLRPAGEARDPVADRVAPAPQRTDAAAPIGGGEAALLVKRGESFLMNGDIASARLLLRRAAEAGNAEAALALGTSYDPMVIARLRAVGVEADPAEAQEWYRKAEALGSQAASVQLAKLAHPDR